MAVHLLSISEVLASSLSTGGESLRRSKEDAFPVFSWVRIAGMTPLLSIHVVS